MKIYEGPKCICGNPAMCLYAEMWLCGKCLAEFDKKKKQKIRELFLTG